MEEREKDRENEECSAVFDANGKVNPWILDSFQQFLTCQLQGTKEVKARSTNEGFEMKASLPSEQKVHSKKQLQSASRNDERNASKNTELQHETSTTQTTEKKRQTLLKLLEEAATKGVSILKDESFVQYCSTVMDLEDEHQVVNKENTEKSHPIPSGSDKESCSEEMCNNGNSKSAEQEKGNSKEKRNMLGPMVKNPMDKDHAFLMEKATVSKGQEKFSFSENTAGPTVHNVLSQCKVQHVSSFAEIAKKGQSTFVNSKSSLIPILHNPSNHETSPPIPSLHNPSPQGTSSSSSCDDSPIFRISPEILAKRIEACSHSIIGRITFTKEDTPWLLKKLREKLESIWNLKTPWRLISLGKGFYHILLHSKGEWEKVWARGPLFLKPGVLRLQKWSIDFDHSREKTTNAQVWFRIYHLPWGLWNPDVIAGIARKVGTPLKFDKTTSDGDFGHYARILVDVDLSKSFLSNIHVQCGNLMIEVKMVPESLPQFCRGCNSIGHSMVECRSISKQGVISKPYNGVRGVEPKLQNAASIGNSPFRAGSFPSNKNNSTTAPDSEKVDKNMHCMENSAILSSHQSKNDKGLSVKEGTSSKSGEKSQKQPDCLPMVISSEGVILTECATTKDTLKGKGQDNSDSIPLQNKFHVLEETAITKPMAQKSVHHAERDQPLTATLLRKQKWADIFTNNEVISSEDQSEHLVDEDNVARPPMGSPPSTAQ